MEGEYKKAFDFVTNTGQGLMDEGKDVTEIVKKMCPYYYELDHIMGSRASTYPIELFESEYDAMEEIDRLEGISIATTSTDNDANDEQPVRKPQKKRPISLVETQKMGEKQHPAVELLHNLSSAVEKSANQKAEAKALEMEVKLKELAASSLRAESEANFRSKELDGQQESGSGAKPADDSGKRTVIPN
jgi:hypothetical protein